MVDDDEFVSGYGNENGDTGGLDVAQIGQDFNGDLLADLELNRVSVRARFPQAQAVLSADHLGSCEQTENDKAHFSGCFHISPKKLRNTHDGSLHMAKEQNARLG